VAEYGSMDNIRTKIINGDVCALRVSHTGGWHGFSNHI